jgi:hypothetical protein
MIMDAVIMDAITNGRAMRAPTIFAGCRLRDLRKYFTNISVNIFKRLMAGQFDI